MRDIETVVKGYRCCHSEDASCIQCPYNDGTDSMDGCAEMTRDVMDLLDKLQLIHPRVLALDEIMNSAGSGWMEEWLEADPEDGTPETHELLEAAWCHGDVVFDNSYTDAEQLKAFYLKPYGIRVWNVKPTHEEMEAEPWTK